ncbi:MAG: DUF1638 domain-containing protein [Myxococcales bacterium]|nr:DUF1638 domain-containing protein [Myxococcales bacterium]MDH5306116.1 DUF1638 domain-containing protein [Myxococcales bacterium]MDH5567519.1 DUF1638 domain-containing protein [Myxococcales bacterium]
MGKSVLLIACGALAREITELQRLGGWEHVALDCLPALLHNRPDRIPDAVRKKIEAARDRYARIFVAYGDCGTGGRLDAVLDEYGVERLPGPHCYAFYSGEQAFGEISAAELGTFYLTDFLVRHFDALVFRGLGLDRHPELASVYFKNYRRLTYLAQTESAELQGTARACADRLGLEYHYHFTGLGPLGAALGSGLQG